MLGKFNLFKKTLNMNMNMNMNICFKKFSEKVNLRKDYYQILGVPKSATEEEIKKAYRELAKIYHPDVSISSGSETKTPSIDKFREIAEAYAVLSNKTFRLDYDTRMRHFPDMVYNAEKLKKMKENENERDKTGNVTKQAPMKGSYAEYRLEKLKQIRKEFNVDQYGSYKGGVPRQDNGPMRGNSYGIPGMHHDPWFHNEKIHDTPHVRDHVSTKEAVDHKLFMNPSRQGYQRFRPYFKMDEIEKDENYYVDSEHRRLFVIVC
jgi:curved DNA-binding protein CbpA